MFSNRFESAVRALEGDMAFEELSKQGAAWSKRAAIAATCGAAAEVPPKRLGV